MNETEIRNLIKELGQRRYVFSSEADLQFELAMLIKSKYKKAKVQLEYCPYFEEDEKKGIDSKKIYIDILVTINNKRYPIELKYKTKCEKNRKFLIDKDGEKIILKNHAAVNENCYLYLNDIQKIERLKDKNFQFERGFTIFITNELLYEKGPKNEHVIYKNFSLKDGTHKKGLLDWENAGDTIRKRCENPINLQDEYDIKWYPYSIIEDKEKAVEFKYLLNTISKNK